MGTGVQQMALRHNGSGTMGPAQWVRHSTAGRSPSRWP
jgi:hypothetical protein